MNQVWRWLRSLTVVLAVIGASGCASTTPGDPFESVNRSVYSFNSALDSAVLKPVATAYKNYVPWGLQEIARNFFSNIDDIFVGVNNLLQGKPIEALSDWGRFLLNSTLGFFGIADPATEMGLEKHREDFGQTLGVWGIPTGPYVVLPLFGPSSFRGTTGFVVDWVADPTDHVIEKSGPRLGATGLRVIDTRAGLLGATNVLSGAALDEYSFVRNGYLQRRRSLVYDGDPPELDDPEEDEYDPDDDEELDAKEDPKKDAKKE
jgi:phospholipid-binding lipoprotein MlaA